MYLLARRWSNIFSLFADRFLYSSNFFNKRVCRGFGYRFLGDDRTHFGLFLKLYFDIMAPLDFGSDL